MLLFLWAVEGVLKCIIYRPHHLELRAIHRTDHWIKSWGTHVLELIPENPHFWICWPHNLVAECLLENNEHTSDDSTKSEKMDAEDCLHESHNRIHSKPKKTYEKLTFVWYCEWHRGFIFAFSSSHGCAVKLLLCPLQKTEKSFFDRPMIWWHRLESLNTRSMKASCFRVELLMLCSWSWVVLMLNCVSVVSNWVFVSMIWCCKCCKWAWVDANCVDVVWSLFFVFSSSNNKELSCCFVCWSSLRVCSSCCRVSSLNAEIFFFFQMNRYDLFLDLDCVWPWLCWWLVVVGWHDCN